MLITEAARRVSAAVTMHSMVPDSVGKYTAFSLADGRSPDGNTLYDFYRDAVRHVSLKPGHHAIVKIPVDGMPVQDAEKWLRLMRKIHDAGFRLTDPDTPAPIMPLTDEALKKSLSNPLNVRFGYHA